MGGMLITNDTEKMVEGGREERMGGGIGCEGFTAPTRQARPYRDVLVVMWCGLPLPNPTVLHVCVSPPTLMLCLMSAVLHFPIFDKCSSYTSLEVRKYTCESMNVRGIHLTAEK